MIKDYRREQHYKVQAAYYEGQRLLLKADCVAHLEDKEDEVFWSAVFRKAVPEKKIQFLYSSINEKGNNTTGVDHCLLYKPYLSRTFFICIDSDYRYLTQEVGINIEQYIFQTYTYSIENHFCYPGGLNDICFQTCNLQNDIFDFQAFAKDFSSIIYELYVWHLYFVKQDISQFDKPEFFKIIDFHQSNIDYTDARQILEELKKRVTAKLEAVSVRFSNIDLNSLKIQLEQSGLMKENAFLYIRGHHYFDLICKTGTAVCEKILKCKKDKLSDSEEIAKLYRNKKPFKTQILNNVQFGQYPELDRIEKDILSLLLLT
ncbi:MAG: DUF4435 domain-containing protein [Tannerella sp.]|nr:DUF4435 domain-containing protein [Tannerella sp.]